MCIFGSATKCHQKTTAPTVSIFNPINCWGRPVGYRFKVLKSTRCWWLITDYCSPLKCSKAEQSAKLLFYFLYFFCSLWKTYSMSNFKFTNQNTQGSLSIWNASADNLQYHVCTQKAIIFNFSLLSFIDGKTFACHLLSIKIYHP